MQSIPKMLISYAVKDEGIARKHGADIAAHCERLRVGVQHRDIHGALHHEALTKAELTS